MFAALRAAVASSRAVVAAATADLAAWTSFSSSFCCAAALAYGPRKEGREKSVSDIDGGRSTHSSFVGFRFIQFVEHILFLLL